MKLVIIGANGQLGFDLVRTFKKMGYEIIPFNHLDIDVTDFEISWKKLKNIKPDAVINCGAYVRVDDSEKFADRAFSVNALGARNIALICKEIDSILMHISTDYIFDGQRTKAYTEMDIPNPLNVYGNSKLAGEYFVKNIIEKHYIIRLSSLFGFAGASGKGGNFVETMIKKARNKEKIEVVDDMVVSPTYTKDAADVIYAIFKKKVPFGVYHIANKGQCSWYEFARTVFETIGIDVNLSPIKTNMLYLKAKRPIFSPLQSVKLKTYGIEIERWDTALKNYLIEKDYLK